MKQGKDLLSTVKKNIKGKKHTDDYILGYLDAVADITGAVSVCQAKFTLESYQARCVEWSKKKP